MWNPMEAMGMGHGNDSLIAHITPKEAKILMAFGGKGTVNPHTGFLQFYSDSGSDTGSDADDAGNDSFGGSGMEGSTASDMDSFAGDNSFGGDDAADLGAGTGMTENAASLTGSGLEEGQALGSPDIGMNVQDMDIGPQNMGMMESLGARARASYNSFMDDPIGSLTPSYSTLGMILGALSPMPGGMMFGNFMGRQADKYGFNTGPAPDLSPRGEERGVSEEMMGSIEPQSDRAVAGLASPVAASSAVAPEYSTKSYLQSNAWRNLSNSGRGGGGLSRLLRG